MHTIVHLSDLHFGRDEPEVCQALVEDLAEQSPTLVVISGDFTQRARRRQYRRAAEFLTRLPQPQLVVPGNHDIPLYDLVRRFLFPLDRYRRYITPELSPVFRTDGLMVMGLNSARSFSLSLDGFWKDGSLSIEQLQTVRQTVQALPKDVFKVLVTHHPFIPPPRERPHGIIRDATRALETIEQCHFDLLLAGHLHMGYSGDVRTHHQTTRRSILSVQAGTAVSNRRRHEPNAYNWITIKGFDEVVVEVRTFNGQVFQPVRRDRFIRTAELWEAVEAKIP